MTFSAIIFQSQSILIVLIMTLGIILKKQRRHHVRLMATSIVWDILLILQIELTRGAVAKASQVAKNALLLNIHVTLAVSTVIFYLAMIYTGRQILSGKKQPLHKPLGWITYCLRLLTFITSFGAV